MWRGRARWRVLARGRSSRGQSLPRAATAAVQATHNTEDKGATGIPVEAGASGENPRDCSYECPLLEAATPGSHAGEEVVRQVPGALWDPLVLPTEISVDVLLLMPRAWSTVEEMWDGAQCDLVACISAKIARVCATEHADIEES
jgi:hypothetical protein